MPFTLLTAAAGRGPTMVAITAPTRIRVFWQPGCTSCLRTKEFLSKHGVDYESINVQDDEAGMAALVALGARSVPVISLGGRFVYAQSLDDVVKFLGLNLRLHDRLAPAELARRIGIVLRAALRYVAQLPTDLLDVDVRNRKRSTRVLAHHVFRIVEAFLETADGATLTYESTVAPPGPDIVSQADIARYGAAVLARFEQWWAACNDRSCSAPVETYYGAHSLHEVLERTAWHSAQHARQLSMVLEMRGIAPDGPLTQDVLAGLPMPEKVWDD